MLQKSLNQFLQLAELRHYGRAAEACHVSASTLSRSISQLEQQLGARLFDRDNRGVRLTAAGERFRSYARESQALWEKFSDGLLDSFDTLTGELSIFCSVTASYSFLYRLLDPFCHHHPQVQIKLHTGDPDQAIPRVMAGDEALAIGARPDRMPAALAFRPVAKSALVFIGPPGSDADGDLASQPMIVAERGVLRERFERWFQSRQRRPNIVAQVAGNEAIVSMVSLGTGVGLVPQIVLDNSPLAHQVRQLAVTPGLQGIEIGLFALKKRLENRLVQALWQTAATGNNEQAREIRRS